MTIRSALELPLQIRQAPVSTVDVAKRTVELIFTAGATVRRARYAGWDRVPYDEVLVVSDKAVNLERMQAGAPVLDSHATYSTRSQVAVVERAWIEGEKGICAVRFPSAGVDEAADRMFALVAEGIVRNVSVGYKIDELKVEDADKKRDQVERWLINRWTPYEVSFVTVPADAGAQVRSAPELFSAVVTRGEPPIAEAAELEAAATAARMRMRAAQFRL